MSEKVHIPSSSNSLWSIKNESPFLQAIWHSTTDNMFVVGVKGNDFFILEEINNGLEKMFGLESCQIKGRNIRDLVPENIFRSVSYHYNLCIQGRVAISYEETGSNIANESRYWSTLLVPVFGDNDEVIRICGISRETTELKIVCEALNQSNILLEKKVDERTEELKKTVENLRVAMANIKVLSGLMPICSFCKKIRDDEGYWQQVEAYVSERTHARFSHSICPECFRNNYPEIADKV